MMPLAAAADFAAVAAVVAIHHQLGFCPHQRMSCHTEHVKKNQILHHKRYIKLYSLQFKLLVNLGQGKLIEDLFVSFFFF